MLDGRRRDRPRPPVVRHAAAGARRSRAAAADPGRRLLHRRRARRHADRGAPPGGRRSDRAHVDGRARGRRARHGRYGESAVVSPRTSSIRSACSAPTRCWSGATHPPRLQHADARARETSRIRSRRRRQAGLPAQQPQEGPVQRRPLAGRQGTAARAKRPDLRMRLSPRRGVRPRRARKVSVRPGLFSRAASRRCRGSSATATTSSTTATC